MNRIWLYIACVVLIQIKSTAAFSVSPALAEAELILEDLAKVVGIHPMPKLFIDSESYRVAAYQKSNNLIIVEKRALDICAGLDPKIAKSALAFLISHEFVHFLRQHPFPAESEKGFISHAFTMGFEEEEREADNEGAFLAYMAGYRNLHQAVPQLFHAIYLDPVYRKSINAVGYPSLESRKKSYLAAMEIRDELISLYESANILTSSGHYNLAQKIYKYIAYFLKSQELTQSEALTYLMKALSELGENEVKFSYPFELSIDRLRPKREKGLPDLKMDLQLVLELLQSNLRDFDPNHTPSHILLACTYELLAYLEKNEAQQAFYQKKLAYHLSVSRKHAIRKSDKARIHLVEGIAFAHAGDKKKARMAFRKSQALKPGNSLSQLVDHNLRVLDSPEMPPLFKMGVCEQFPVDGISLRDMDCSFKKKAASKRIFLDPENNTYADIVQLKSSQLFDFGLYNDCLFLQRVKSAVLHTQEGIGIGSKLYQLEEAYGPYRPGIDTRSGNSFAAFDDAGLIFLINEKGVVIEWALLRSTELE